MTMNHSTKRTAIRVAVLAVVVLIYLAGRWGAGESLFPWQPSTPSEPTQSDPTQSDGVISVEAAYAQRQSDIWLRIEGVVDRVLKDDRKGSRHQRFIVKLASGHTVLVAHNIDLAERVPIDVGNLVEVNGEYEWTDRGGVIHWTHQDPQRRKQGGWVRYRGRKYQ